MDYFIAAIITVCFAFAFFAGVAYGKFQIIRKMIDQLSDKEIADLQNLISLPEDAEAGASVVDLKQETVNDQVYLYDKSGNFVCQGSNAKEAAERYGNINKAPALVSCDNGGQYLIEAGKIETKTHLVV